ncbi:hypothetical protein [Methylobacterium sp. A54F]
MTGTDQALRRRSARALAVALVAVVLGATGAEAASCRASIGSERAALLVKRCIAVSPATRPPCNDANPCEMIREEIVSGCRMLESDAPAWCRRYP